MENQSVELKQQNKIGEIEGLRVLAALLVAVYHIWFQKVSGGVDIFFLISGFLITLSLYKIYKNDGIINPFFYLKKLAKRLLPSIFLLAIFIVMTFQYFLPNVRLSEMLFEILYSITYVQNWNLALNYDSYLDRTDTSSILQHIWALSIQGQFYIIWLVVFIAFIALRKRVGSSLRTLLIIMFSILFISSLAFSIIYTEMNQVVAYYITPTRVYEFAIGGIIALLFSRININRFTAFIFSFIGILLILGTGIVMDVENAFPSFYALIPIIGAALIIISSKQNTIYTPNSFLKHRVFVKIGHFAYPFYLWHWVIYIYYASYIGTYNISFLDGLIIIMISIVASVLSEQFLSFLESFSRSRVRMGSLTVVFWLLLLSVSFKILIDEPRFADNNVEEGIDETASVDFEGQLDYTQLIPAEQNTGALGLYDSSFQVEQSDDVLPSLPESSGDIGTLYHDNCNQVAEESDIIKCEYGDTSSDIKIALVGGSHTVQWFDALNEIAEQRNLHLVTMTKLACRFTDEELNDSSCVEWNDNVIQDIQENQYDLVITNADISTDDYPEVPEGYLQQFEKLEEMEIPILALRDTPWFQSDMLSCLEENGLYNGECNVPVEEVLDDPSKWEQLENPPDNVHYVDLTDVTCDDGICNPVQGNVIVYWDSHHMTATYVRTLAPFLDDEILEILIE